MDKQVALTFILWGIFGAFYKGIMSLGILSEQFSVLIKLI